MLLNNNKNDADNNNDVAGVTRRRPKSQQGRRVRDKSSSAASRNSWSFAETPEESWKNHEESWKNLDNVYGVSRPGRMRQRGNGNMATANATRSRDHSGHKQSLGTVSKGVDYIRLQSSEVNRKLVITSSDSQSSDSDFHDRSTYGSPDGQSAHSTAERETCLLSADSNNKADSSAAFVRTASARSSARDKFKFRAKKSDEKTDWTFVPTNSNATNPQTTSGNANNDQESAVVRKGLLWVTRDRLFSRWHERFCLLTNNYVHCFKKASEAPGLTQMGAFLFKVNLAEVSSVQWLDKKGTAIVCLNLVKEGRLLIKTSHDLLGWYSALQSGIRDSQDRRQTLLDRRTNGQENLLNKKDQSVTPILNNLSESTNSEKPVIFREKNAAARIRQQHNNRYSLLPEIEVRLAESTKRLELDQPQSLMFITNSNAEQPLQQLQQQQQNLKNSPPPLTTVVPPLPIPYRERSSSFDRSRASKSERETKRRSYFHSQATQV